MVTRNSGASTRALDTGKTVTVACSLNWSDWITKAILDLPKSQSQAAVYPAPRFATGEGQRCEAHRAAFERAQQPGWA